MKAGDRFEFTSPLYKRVVVELIQRQDSMNAWLVQCIEVIREPFVFNLNYTVGSTRFLSERRLKSLWTPVTKAGNFDSLYNKLHD